MRAGGAIVAACLLFWALDAGVVEAPLPDAAWQEQAAQRYSCRVAAVATLELPAQEAWQLVERHCR
jgi:hypothetical protein